MPFKVIRFLKSEVEYNLMSGRFEWLIRNIEYEIDLLHDQMGNKNLHPTQRNKCGLLISQLKQTLHLIYRAKSKKFYENEGWIGGLRVRGKDQQDKLTIKQPGEEIPCQ
jgi:hypothetical protein